VTVKLVPKPQLARCIMASFDDVESAGDAVANVIASGIIPAGLELMDKPMTAAVEAFVHAGYDLDAAAILLCESDGTPEEVEEEIAHERGADASGATRIEVSRDEAQRLKFWSGRKNAFPASGGISPDYMCMDSTIPRARLADMLRRSSEMEKKYGLRCCQRLPRRRRQPASADPVRRQRSPISCTAARLFGAEILELSVAWAAPSPASTASASRSSTRCACSSRPPSARSSSPSSAPSTRRSCSIRARSSPRCSAAPSTARCTCIAACCRSPTCRVSDVPAMTSPNPAALAERVRRRARPAIRCDIRGGGTKQFYGRSAARRARWTCAARRHRRLRADRTGGHRARRHAARGARSACSPSAASACPSSRRASRCRTDRGGTVGGMVAAGLAGPGARGRRRVRDYVLGVRLLNGRGDLMHFGGQVMKNVAGYDVSRLLAGSWGRWA
jgi:hypothetical protein